jgi:hypothetical protein
MFQQQKTNLCKKQANSSLLTAIVQCITVDESTLDKGKQLPTPPLKTSKNYSSLLNEVSNPVYAKIFFFFGGGIKKCKRGVPIHF